MPWITAIDAFRRDSTRHGGNLVDFAADGLLRTKAAAFIRDGGGIEREVLLETDFWRSMQTRTHSVYRDWQTGTFDAEISSRLASKRPVSLRAVGVRFDEDDLNALFPRRISATPEADAPVAHAEGGRERRGRPRADGWNDWIAELAVISYVDGLVGLTAAKLIETINERLSLAGKEEMPASTVQAAARCAIEAVLAVEDRKSQ